MHIDLPRRCECALELFLQPVPAFELLSRGTCTGDGKDSSAQQRRRSLDLGTSSAHSWRMRRSFTVDEANRMLPLVRRIVSDAVRDYWRWQDKVRDFEVAALRSSPEQPDEVAEQLQGEATRLAEEIDGYLGELAELGVLLQGVDTGLVDFPGEVEG